MVDSKHPDQGAPAQRFVPHIGVPDKQQRITTRDFNPFEFTGIFNKIEGKHTGCKYSEVLWKGRADGRRGGLRGRAGKGTLFGWWC
jgi:hypothetical protein